MKALVIYTPFCYPFSPYLSVPILTGQLQNAGFDAKCCDLNADFHSEIYKKDFLINSLKKAKDILNSDEYRNIPLKNLDNSDNELSLKEKIKILKKYIISNTLEAEDFVSYIVNNSQRAVSVLKSDECFNPNSFVEAQNILKAAVDLAFLPFSPCISRPLKKTLFKNNYNDIKFQAMNEDINPYFEFYRQKIKEGVFDGVNVVFLSLAHPNQLIPGFTLGKFLKEKNIKVIIGGNYITRVRDAFINNPDIFDTFIDGLILCDGENAVVEYAEYIDSKRDIKEVSNLVYKSYDGSLVQNEIEIYRDINNRALPSLDGFDYSKYLIPIKAFTMQTSKGCYWRKCTFCDYSYGKPVFSSYSVDKLIEELKYFHKKHGIKCFEFVDDSLVVGFFEKVADRLIEENMDIKIYCYFRLESSITKELLEKFHKAGVVGIQWGYEATSERIMKIMNKGIDVHNRLNILRMSTEAGIWNRCFGIAGFPTETEDEIIATIDTFRNNPDIINSFELYHFGLFKHSKINKNKEQFGIKRIIESDEFSLINNFTTQKQPMGKIPEAYKKLEKSIANRFWTQCIPDEYLMIFLTKYSAKELNSFTF